MIFKGYVKIKGKEPLEKIKNGKYHTLEEIENMHCDYAGILDDPYIQIDVDEPEQAQKLLEIVRFLELKTNVLQTSRGLHFYFENDGVEKRNIKKQNALGITIDTALGKHSAPVPLRIEGGKREWLQEYEDLDILPVWLMAIPKLSVNWSDMTEGDGRNQALFNYILTLQGQGFTKDQIKETILIINKFILDEPLQDREIRTILRDESFKKQSFFIRNAFQHDLFAEFIKNEEHIKSLNGGLYVYHNGIYREDKKLIQSAMLRHLKKLKTNQRNEVLNYLEIQAPRVQEAPTNLLGVGNGIYDLEKDELLPYSPDIILTNRINADYNPAAASEHVDKVLDKIACNDVELRQLIEEMVGYCLLRRNEIGKAFILTGSGSNGKSTLLKMIKRLIGHENISSLGLSELDDRFKTAELVGKLVNIGDDISSEYIRDDAVFKKLVTGETMTVERKGKDPFAFDNYAKLIFSANELPRINDKSDGLRRRLLLIPFNAKFSREDADFDPFIIDKVTSKDAAEYLLLLGLQGLKRILKHGAFTDNKTLADQLREYDLMNNPILEFFAELGEDDIVGKRNDDIYRRYSVWCLENNLKPYSKIQFSRDLCKQFAVESKQKKVKGKSFRVYEKMTME